MIALPLGWFAKNFFYDVEDEEVKNFYSKIENKSPLFTKSSMFYGLRQWDIFRYSLALGVQDGCKELDFKRVNANIPTDHLHDQDIVAMFAAIMSKENVNLEILQDPKKVQTTCENIANYGVRKLIEINSQVDMSNPIKEYETMLTKTISQSKQ